MVKNRKMVRKGDHFIGHSYSFHRYNLYKFSTGKMRRMRNEDWGWWCFMSIMSILPPLLLIFRRRFQFLRPFEQMMGQFIVVLLLRRRRQGQDGGDLAKEEEIERRRSEKMGWRMNIRWMSGWDLLYCIVLCWNKDVAMSHIILCIRKVPGNRTPKKFFRTKWVSLELERDSSGTFLYWFWVPMPSRMVVLTFAHHELIVSPVVLNLWINVGNRCGP